MEWDKKIPLGRPQRNKCKKDLTPIKEAALC
jgi:hypothetical protein